MSNTNLRILLFPQVAVCAVVVLGAALYKLTRGLQVTDLKAADFWEGNKDKNLSKSPNIN